MRPIMHGDVSSAARVLLNTPVARRRRICEDLIREAQGADEYVRRHGTLHPEWGNGSLMSAARKRILAREPGFDNIAYCQCFEMVLRAVIDWQIRQRRS